MVDINKAIVISPHVDDGEMGCGGTMAKLVEEGVTVYYVAFSIAETSVQEGFPKDILATEVKKAARILGISLDHLFVYRYPVRNFPQYRQDILEELVKIRNKINPDLLLMPCQHDIHQDHQVIFQEGLRAFNHTSILGYEMPWNNLTFNTSAFVNLEAKHIDKKVNALSHYQSQQHRSYMDEDFIRDLSRVRGKQIGVEYAEAFQAIRWMIR